MKKVLITILSVIGIIIVAGGGYAYYLYHSAKETADKMHESVNLGKSHTTPKLNSKNAPPISILLLGVDQRKNDVGRSDTIIFITLNPKTEKMQMVSIPRDTRTEIAGRGTMNKINAAYAYGGTKMAIQTVENFTNVPVNYYIRVNMQALSALVDAVGGITVNNKLDWYDEGYYKKGYHYHKGELHLNGKQALGYVRMRHLDPNGDFGRNQRQRQVIEAIIKKAASIKSVTRFNEIFNALGDNVKTNLTFDDMMKIQSNYRGASKNVEQYEVQGTSEKINGIYYLSVPDSERSKVTNMLKSNLQK
ncbi:LCP family protein [Heyndrickxia ginsengihumi]|uniref:Transcriptional regulator LytR n=1 Tax=Heyndrickxia ginsengihumi TaxID=363870 RepID=A0A0A6XWW5_9BACI|nr:LCP family protein [Heyndrickxia ginsengihumi]KHD84637.1 transcriptional regulator LytR [Heyndrickxia ginsengihumi]MCM3024966.1 LCP family protein [Heyndrickxia ginsengihumi]NEY19101.1 transcriptional regulator LytR [Heyndrickxia ginsengihumi]